MNKYGELARELVRRNIGEVRYKEICQQFGLGSTDNDVLSKLISRWIASLYGGGYTGTLPGIQGLL